MHTSDSAHVLPETFACSLDDLGIIKISGEEASKYLQGQITVDLDKLTEQDFMLGCHCDFKGKAWNIFYAFGSKTDIYLLCHREGIAASLAELKKYAVFSKAEIIDDSENWIIRGGKGNEFESACTRYVSSLPSQDRPLSRSDVAFVAYLEQPVKRYLLITQQQQDSDVEMSLKNILVDAQLWDFLDIQSGVANIQKATSNEFVPQMLNMQALDAIDFQKGCYMGQEVVARTKYLGKNKRATFILHGALSDKAQAGAQLEMQVGENWRRGGVIIRSASVEQQTWLLAVLPNDTEQAAVLRLKDAPEQSFTVDELPYELE